ncbi:trigger factor [Luteolibacter sp. AS25]|uniref:trigger factor n=1 Tax=Luteolibacter sp. AS25 TaxID=3135776 RepID=UPI00398A754A
MNIVVEKQPKCIATLNVEVPAADVAAKRASITSTYTSQAKIPGFRPGKAPKSVINKRFGKEISAELNEAIFRTACDEALEKEDLKVLDFGFPENLEEKEDGTITFSTNLILAPEFELPEYKGIEIKSPPTEVTDEELNAQLENLRERLAEFEDVADRPIQNDDIAVVDFTTTIDGKELTEVIGEKGQYLAKRENHWLPIKEGSFLPGYAEQLVGLNEGDKKDVTITLDDEFPFEELRGKELTLHTSVEGIKTQKLPELDDAFAEKLVPGKGLEDIKDMLRDNMGQEKVKQVNDLKVNQIVEHLNKVVTFDLPEAIVERETQNQANALVEEGTKQGASEDDIVKREEEIFSAATQRATTNLSTNFILQEIAREEKISVSDNDLLARIQQIAEQRKEPIKKVIKDLQKNNQIQSIRNSMIIGQTIDFLLEQAKVTEVSAEEFEAKDAE